jgi:hypothetical protein
MNLREQIVSERGDKVVGTVKQTEGFKRGIRQYPPLKVGDIVYTGELTHRPGIIVRIIEISLEKPVKGVSKRFVCDVRWVANPRKKESEPESQQTAEINLYHFQEVLGKQIEALKAQQELVDRNQKFIEELAEMAKKPLGEEEFENKYFETWKV